MIFFVFILLCVSRSDYRNWTCLHHAACAGYTQTMEILLSTNPKLLDKTDEDGVPLKYYSQPKAKKKKKKIK